MNLPEAEPLTEEQIAAWMEAANAGADVCAAIYAATEAHRAEHGCDAFPSGSGPLLSILAAIARPKRVLEVGTGLGYSALMLAHGAPLATVDTVEQDSSHADLAEEWIRSADSARQVRVLRGSSQRVLAQLEPPYDFVFFDGDPDTCLEDLDQFERLTQSGGILVSSNLFLGRYVPDAPWIPKLAGYRKRLIASGSWRTVFMGKALSIRC